MSEHFTMKLRFAAPPERVYEAILAGERWWSRHVSGRPEVGRELEFRFPEAEFHARMRVKALEPGRLVEWECVDQQHPASSGWSDLRDWIGTTVRFALAPDGDGGTRLTFEHVGLMPALECHEACSSAWAFYVNDSLRGLAERGEGKPFDDDNFAR